jgi:hypothetical protein
MTKNKIKNLPEPLGEPVYDGVPVEDAEYQAIRHQREAEKRSEGEIERLGDVLGSLFVGPRTLGGGGHEPPSRQP